MVFPLPSSPRSSRLYLLSARPRLALGILVAVFGVWLAGARADEGRLADPIPMRRVVLPADRIVAEMKRAGEGVYVRMRRDEFERLVQEAAHAVRGRHEPRLAEAHYRASLVASVPGRSPGLTGTAQWKIIYAGNGAALLRLGDGAAAMNVAVSKPRYDNREAILTHFDDPKGDKVAGSLALLVDQPGEHTLTLDWSARAEARPEGLVVDLRLPVSPAASLELELHEDRIPIVLDPPAGTPGTGVEPKPIVSGPHPAEAGNRRVWRIACGGRSHLPLLLRRTEAGQTEAVVLVSQKTIQKLSPDGVESGTTLSLEGVHQGVRDLSCLLDAALRPIEVIAPDLERWQVEPASGGQSRLKIRLAKPIHEGEIKVRCLAPLATTRARGTPGKGLLLPWSSPGLRLEKAVPRGETLELWLHPDLRLLAWQPGDFRLIDSAVLVDVESGQKQRRLTLQGGGLAPAGGNPRRPGGTIQSGNVEYLVTQQTWWRFRAGTMELTARLECRVRQGQMFQIPLRLPAGWEVEGVDLDPSDQLHGWGVRGGPGAQTLFVDLRRPLQSRAEGSLDKAVTTINLRLRPRDSGPWTGRDLLFPDVVPLGARLRNGGLAIDYDERIFRAQSRTVLPASDVVAGSPWGQSIPDLYYPFQGDSLRGTLKLMARPPRLRARNQTEAVVLPNRVTIETRLRLEARTGEPRVVDLFISDEEPTEAPWKWQLKEKRSFGPRIRRVERRVDRECAAELAFLGGRTSLERLTCLAARPRGSSWRIEFDRPMRVHEPLMLVGRSVRPRTSAITTASVPLVTVLGAAFAGELTLVGDGTEILGTTPSGRREAAASSGGGRAYRWSDPHAWLSVQVRSLAVAAPAGAVLDRACLTTVLTLQGEMRHHFRFRVSRWGQRLLPVRMPAKAILLAAAADGKWLEPAMLLDAEGRAHLPIPSGPNATWLEILYVTPAPAFRIGHRLEAGSPDLPIAPIDFQRRWLLPPGVLPIVEGSLIPLPGASWPNGRSLPGRLMGLMRLGSGDAFLGGIGLPVRDVSATKEVDPRALRDAFAGLRNNRARQKMPLERVIEDLVVGYLRQRCPLIVDQHALVQEQFTPGSIVTIRPPSEAGGEQPMPWEETNLLVMPCRAGALLTTAKAMRQWAGVVPDQVQMLLVGSDQGEVDPSGRFATAVDWLGRGGASPPGVLDPGTEWDGWSAWQISGGPAEAGTIWVVRQSAPTVGGVVLAGLFGLVLLRRKRSPRPVLLVGLGLSGLAAAWLPASLTDLAWLPLLAGLLASLALYLTWASRQRKPGTPVSAVVPKPALIALLLFGSTLAGHAQRPRPDPPLTVFLIAGTEKGNATVLAPSSLVESLRKRKRPMPGPGLTPVLLSSEATGRVVSGRAEITATFVAQSFSEDSATLLLPLAEIQLVGDVLLDGARVLPESRSKPVGYAIGLRGQGRHKIELRFQVPVSRLTPAREADVGARQVSFRLPGLVQSRLVFQLPEGAHDPQAPTRQGMTRLVVDGKVQRLEVEVGAVSTPVLIHWIEDVKSAPPVRLAVRQAHLWDLRADASLLTTLLRYDISGMGVSTLEIAVPRDLDVRGAGARRPLRSVGGTESAARLSDWRITGSGPDRSRTLRLEFPGPISGEVEVTLELVPREPWSGIDKPGLDPMASVLLPLPRPLGVVPGKAPAYLAYRIQGVQADRIDWRRLNGIKAADFAPYWPASTRPATASIEYASTFQGDAKQLPELRLQLRPRDSQVQSSHSIHLHVGPAQAEWKATVELSAPGKDLSLAQWDILSAKPLTITSVQGSSVSRWVQTDGRLTVWFEKTTDAARVELSGWVALEMPGTQLDIPCLKPVPLPRPALRSSTRLSLTAASGISLASLALRQLQVEPSRPGTLAYRAIQPHYGATFLVRPGPTAQAEIVTTVRLVASEVVFESNIDTQAPEGQGALSVRMRGWEGDAWLEARQGAAWKQREQHRRQSGQRERLWSLQRSAGTTGRVRLRLIGRAALDDEAEGVGLPEISLPGVQTRHVLIVDPSLLAEIDPGLVPLPAPAGSAVGVRAWLAQGEASARVVPREQPRPPPVVVVLAEQRARLADGQRWLYEYRCWVRHEGPAEVLVRWPTPVEVVSVALGPADGALGPISKSAGADGRALWLPLPPTPTIHLVSIRFRHPTGHDSPQRPDRGFPVLEGAVAGQMLWTIDVPAGYDLVGTEGITLSGATRQTLASLMYAGVQLAVCRELAGQHDATAEYGRAHQRLHRSLNLAEMGLQAGGDRSLPMGPSRQTLQGWLARMEQETRSLPSSDVREEWKDEGAQTFGGMGHPVSWLGEGGEESPLWQLEPTRRRGLREAVVFSAQWLALLLVVAVVALSSRLRTVARWLWPEQLILLGLGSWLLAGLGLLALALMAIGLIGRVHLLARGVRTLFTPSHRTISSSLGSRA